MENFDKKIESFAKDLKKFSADLVDFQLRSAELYSNINEFANEEFLPLKESNDFISSVLCSIEYGKLENFMEVFEYLSEPQNYENMVMLANYLVMKYSSISKPNVLH